MAATHRGVNILGGTFALTSQYPKLHMPAVKLADADLANPKNSKCLLDGEWVRLGQATSEGNNVVIGSRRAFEFLAANQPTVTVVGGDDNDTIAGYVDGARPINPASELRLTHGRKGRGDTQMMLMKPVIDDNRSFSYLYRLIDDTATYAIGDPLFVRVIANANLPTFVKNKMGITRNVVGLVPGSVIAALGDAALNGQILPSVGRVIGTKDANGFIMVQNEFSDWTIVGAAN